jgi:hypothetical protein
MFWKKRNLYFVHIPKNAGNSIRPICRKENIKVITHNIRRQNKRLLANYRGEKSIHAFCVSRNPYDRVVSAYYYLLNNKKHKHDIADRKKFIDPFADFSDFVKNGLREAAEKQLHFLPQVFWIKNREGIPEIETILKMENLQNDFNHFCRDMNLKPRQLEFTNASQRKNWEGYFFEETRNIVFDIYNEDFEYFEYEK